MTLTQEEYKEMHEIGRSLDTSGQAMDEEMFWGASDRYNELQNKMAEPEVDVPFLSIRQPGDLRPIGS